MMPSDDSDRQRRLAEALRTNLRRRKGQARERASSPPADTPKSDGPESGTPPPSDRPDSRD